MRVMQLIDSLRLGGAERMAVNYANMLAPQIERSYLCTTRAEGDLREMLDTHVSYLFLKRKRTLDINALLRLSRYIKKEHIDCIHAHGSSYFIATLLKLSNPSLKLIWHNHLGASILISKKALYSLKICSYNFDTIIAVNDELLIWAEQHLNSQKVIYISNFVEFDNRQEIKRTPIGGIQGKRIVCLANLKNPKGHTFLLESFALVSQEVPEVTLHLIGEDYQDAYSNSLRVFIKENDLGEHIFIYGKVAQPESVLLQCDIGVLASSSEGLPMALLEYGRARLAVVVTDVGQCALVVKDYGTFVKYGNKKAFAKGIIDYLNDRIKYDQDKKAFHNHVKSAYSSGSILKQIVNLYSEVIG